MRKLDEVPSYESSSTHLMNCLLSRLVISPLGSSVWGIGIASRANQNLWSHLHIRSLGQQETNHADYFLHPQKMVGVRIGGPCCHHRRVHKAWTNGPGLEAKLLVLFLDQFRQDPQRVLTDRIGPMLA